jgi:Trp operon repressor
MAADGEQWDEEIARLRGEPDLLRRGRRATELLLTCQERTEVLAQIRRTAVDELRRNGVTYSEIATGLGVSKGRISQLWHEKLGTEERGDGDG